MDLENRNVSPHGVSLCIHSVNYVLAVWNLFKSEQMWKFPGESANIGESPPDTLVRGALEEAGLKIPVVRNAVGIIETLGDVNVKVDLITKTFFYPNHLKYFYKIRISDSHILSLSDQLLRADHDELLWTWAFPFMRPLKMANFHRGHKARFEEIIYSKPRTA